jgi:hypothetical protein
MDERRAALAAFRDGDVRFLIATDVAARGIDVKELPYGELEWAAWRPADARRRRLGRNCVWGAGTCVCVLKVGVKGCGTCAARGVPRWARSCRAWHSGTHGSRWPLPTVINMTLPDKSEDYIHRVR